MHGQKGRAITVPRLYCCLITQKLQIKVYNIEEASHIYIRKRQCIYCTRRFGIKILDASQRYCKQAKDVAWVRG